MVYPWRPAKIPYQIAYYPIWNFLGQVLAYHLPFVDNAVKLHDDQYLESKNTKILSFPRRPSCLPMASLANLLVT
jgi:hypothetical protein